MIAREDAAMLGRSVLERCDALAAFTETPGELTRTFLTPAHRGAIELVAGWMREAGLEVRLDAAGTLIGRLEGDGREARTLLVGSHLDTVRNAGRFDGMLGVVAALASLDLLRRAGRRLSFPVEIVAFGDEEGARFGVALIGSRALAGSLPPAWLGRTDGDGITLGEAFVRFGLDPAGLAAAGRTPDGLLGWLELHIEQGPVLEDLGQPLGTVSAICGATKALATFHGEAGHAGTVPMGRRRDAVAGAGEFILAVERAATEAGIVATVGRIGAVPGAGNVIAGRVDLSLDLRAADDGARRKAFRRLCGEAQAITARRGLRFALDILDDTDAVPCDPALMAACDRVLAARGWKPLRLPSGAGHDGIALGAIMPIAMLFLRCAGGVSHHPAESITEADAAEGVLALADVLLQLCGDAGG